MSEPRPTVFIGSSSEGHKIAKAIQSNLEPACEPEIWSQGLFRPSDGTLESVVSFTDKFDFAILVLTDDYMTELRGEKAASPRDNVILELGIFLGAIGRDRTFAVCDSATELKLPSDLEGVTISKYRLHSSGKLRTSLGGTISEVEETMLDRGKRIRTIATEDDHGEILDLSSDPTSKGAKENASDGCNHFYTIGLAERDLAIASHGYKSEGIACHVFKKHADGTVPLFRLRKNAQDDHFYTISEEHRDNAVVNRGFVWEGIVGHVFSSQQPSSVPFHRLFNHNRGDHFYTASNDDRDKAIAKGYTLERTEGYVLEAEMNGTVPLYRLKR